MFTISCTGTISITLPDSTPYNFIYHTTNHTILAHPSSQLPLLNKRSTLQTFHRRSLEGLSHVGTSFEPFTFLAGPLHVSDHYQIGYAPRCPAIPFGLQSFERTGARGTGVNGCGADNGMKFPDFRFEACCNGHDLCYDNCGTTWEDCNDTFRKCMQDACAEYYSVPRAPPFVNATSPDANSTTWSQWGCDGLADTYATAVGTRIGAWSFNIANKDRCDCGCPVGTMNCTDMCLSDCGSRCDVIGCDGGMPAGSASGLGLLNLTSTIATTASPTANSSVSTSSKIGATTLAATTTASGTSASTSATSSSTTGGGWWPFGR
ncbi:hypothetical protein EJ08DRAFT_678973 [Tothia fuscella]|uniref:Phospholipase A2 n=1 Tax=Tothia fuscella TaxID=1048955 RepID=A0A9P4NSL1_9PEZI|nr:hypothetical protein EJ08DRAFT_678973 [Tothia fuscella]